MKYTEQEKNELVKYFSENEKVDKEKAEKFITALQIEDIIKYNQMIDLGINTKNFKIETPANEEHYYFNNDFECEGYYFPGLLEKKEELETLSKLIKKEFEIDEEKAKEIITNWDILQDVEYYYQEELHEEVQKKGFAEV